MMPNLRDTYGKSYRVSYDPCADSFHDPAMHTIPTRTGEVYVHSETHAGVEISVRYRNRIKMLLGRGSRIHQDTADMVVFLVPWESLEGVLPLLRPCKRRQVSEEERQRLIEITKRARFSKVAGRDTQDEGTPTGSGAPR
jgi:hypothetical protein